jgi:hypothetical protein
MQVILIASTPRLHGGLLKKKSRILAFLKDIVFNNLNGMNVSLSVGL